MSKSKSETPFAFFHQNEALLYQFFLYECIQSVQQAKKESGLEQLMESRTTQFYSLQGHLPKMLHYYELQLAHFDSHPVMKSIGQALDRAYLSGQVCLNAADSDSAEQKKAYAQFQQELIKVGKLLLDHAPHHKENPHVLYFLLCHHTQLDALYGKPHTAELLSSLFAGGIEEVESFLSESLTKKGFHHLLPQIQKHVESLNNE